MRRAVLVGALLALAVLGFRPGATGRSQGERGADRAAGAVRRASHAAPPAGVGAVTDEQEGSEAGDPLPAAIAPALDSASTAVDPALADLLGDPEGLERYNASLAREQAEAALIARLSASGVSEEQVRGLLASLPAVPRTARRWGFADGDAEPR